MATVLVSKQIYFALHKDIGSRKDAILYITAPYKVRTVALNKLMLNKFRSIPQIEIAGFGNAAPLSGNTNSTIAVYKNGKTESKTGVEIKSGDENYINIYGIKLLAGRNIQVTDTGKALVINNTFAKLMGFKNPQDAVGKIIEKYNGQQSPRIVGVVADFSERSIHTAIKPLVIAYGRGDYETGTLHIRLKPETAGSNEWKTAIAAMTREWKKIYPNDDFSYQFYDESIRQFYNVEQHMAELLRWATGLCILISCLGLIGLAIYTTNQRTKEIGVRKVLGATVAQIVKLLSAELVWLIVLASLVVTPVAWYAMNYWLQGFAERTSISWWIFATSAIGMLLAAVFTSSFQTIKAAIANPVKSLRSE
jgi:ABC-type antimicrobial peptide transport system permease subunit